MTPKLPPEKRKNKAFSIRLYKTDADLLKKLCLDINCSVQDFVESSIKAAATIKEFSEAIRKIQKEMRKARLFHR
jgi:hypothetical protein